MAKAPLRIRRGVMSGLRHGLGGMTKGRVLGQSPDFGLDGRPLAPKKVLDCDGETGIADPVCAPSRRRQVAALDFVLALRASLDARQLVGDRVFDGLIVAGLEMQEAEVAEAAPIAAVK